MKRLLILTISLIVVISLSSCGNKPKENTPDAKEIANQVLEKVLNATQDDFKKFNDSITKDSSNSESEGMSQEDDSALIKLMNEKYKDLLTEHAIQKGLASRDLMKVVMMVNKYNSPINPQNIKLNKENDTTFNYTADLFDRGSNEKIATASGKIVVVKDKDIYKADSIELNIKEEAE